MEIAWHAIVLAVVYDVGTIASVEHLELGVFVKLLEMALLLCLALVLYQLYGTLEG